MRTAATGGSVGRTASPNGSRPRLPTVQRPKVNLCSGLGVYLSSAIVRSSLSLDWSEASGARQVLSLGPRASRPPPWLVTFQSLDESVHRCARDARGPSDKTCRAPVVTAPNNSIAKRAQGRIDQLIFLVTLVH